jgi:hypothetical protein
MTGLCLWDVAITDKGVAWLREHAYLESVSIMRTPITDAAVDTFATLPKLVNVSLASEGITDAGVAKVAALAKVTSVQARLPMPMRLREQAGFIRECTAQMVVVLSWRI